MHSTPPATRLTGGRLKFIRLQTLCKSSLVKETVVEMKTPYFGDAKYRASNRAPMVLEVVEVNSIFAASLAYFIFFIIEIHVQVHIVIWVSDKSFHALSQYVVTILCW